MDCDLRCFDLDTRLLDPADNQFGPRCYLCNRYITFSNPGLRAGPYIFGGADGIRTHDLLDAIEARSQLRHGPTGSIE
jgi:hypothetical protein